MGREQRTLSDLRRAFETFNTPDPGQVIPPQRTECAWHPVYFDGAIRVLVDVPEDDRGVSHGLCDDCAPIWLARQ
jgi:hypothetical protein